MALSRRLSLAGLMVAACPLLAAEPHIADVERWQALKVGASSIPVSGVLLSSGHATWTLRTGNLAPVRAGEEVVGIYFEGEGALEYRSPDAIEAPLTVWETKKATSLKLERAGADIILRDGFQRLLWLSSGRPLPETPGFPGGSSASAGASGPSLQPSFQKNREKFFHVAGAPAAHLFALHRANGAGEALVLAEMEGGQADLRYVFDSYAERSEALLSLHHPERGDADLRRSLYPVVLSEQTIGRDRRDPLPPPFVLSDVRVDLTASGGTNADLVVHETLVPQRRALSVLRFHLTSWSYDFVGSAGINRHAHRVRAVTDENGRRLAFHHQHGDLLVALEAPAAPDRPVKLKFEIEGDYLIRPGGDNFWLLGTSAWFPQPDIAGQYFTFHARVKVKKPFVAFAPGKTVARAAEDDFNVLETDLDEPVQFAVLLAGKYEFDEETRNGITIRVASYAVRNQRAVKQLTNLAFAIIDYYQRFLGPFPFPEFNILEINDYGFGQAPPATLFITKEAFNPYLGAANQLYSEGVNERFAHEIAHQYWGHAVKMPSEEEQWLTESFAEYSAALFLRDFKGKSTFRNCSPTGSAGRWSRPGSPRFHWPTACQFLQTARRRIESGRTCSIRRGPMFSARSTASSARKRS